MAAGVHGGGLCVARAVHVFFLVFLVGLVGCAGQPTTTQPSRQAITVDDALVAVLTLPEVKAADAYIREKTNGANHGATLADSEEPVAVAGKRYWQIAFVEDTPELVHRWWTFLVEVNTGTVLVEDYLTGLPMDLDYWRAKEKPLQQISPNASGGA